MGIFGKQSNRIDPKAAVAFCENAVDNPAGGAAILISSTEQPVFTIAQILLMMLKEGDLKASELQLLGIDENELASIVEAFKSSKTVDEAMHQLQVGAVMAEYNKQVVELVREKNLTLTEEQVESFRSNLCQFAFENDITDLKLAHRLMCAEGVDPLRPPTASAGYL